MEEQKAKREERQQQQKERRERRERKEKEAEETKVEEPVVEEEEVGFTIDDYLAQKKTAQTAQVREREAINTKNLIADDHDHNERVKPKLHEPVKVDSKLNADNQLLGFSGQDVEFRQGRGMRGGRGGQGAPRTN